MQSRTALSALPIFFGILLLGFSKPAAQAQSKTELENQKIAESDSLFSKSARACLDPLESQKAETWLFRARVLSGIMEDPTLSARHSQTDLPTETANAYLMLRALDGSQQYRQITEPGLAGICIDLGNAGIHSLENARLYQSAEDARMAAQLLEKAMECYKLTGDSKEVVDREWKKHSLDLNWLRFFSGVAARKAGEKTRASQIYASLYDEKWPKTAFFLESADLSDSLGLTSEAIEMLQTGLVQIPGNIEIRCALVHLFLKSDKINEAKAQLKKLELIGQSRYHPDYAYAQGAYFEKKGDLKKAEACYQIPYKADPNEVSGIRRYAAFLLRKALLPETSNPQETASEALKMLEKAKDLSPENAEIDKEIEGLLARYPGLRKS